LLGEPGCGQGDDIARQEIPIGSARENASASTYRARPLSFLSRAKSAKVARGIADVRDRKIVNRREPQIQLLRELRSDLGRLRATAGWDSVLKVQQMG
jgi:hypothetical protein